MSATKAQHLLLAGDVGGTNTRLALYEPEGNFDSTDCSNRSRYRNPLFVKKYRNEETLLCSAGSKSAADSKAAFSNDECCNNTVAKFVQAIIAPFLEEASKALIESNKLHGSWSNVTIAACLGVAGPVDTSLNNGTVTTSQRDYLVGLNGDGIVQACRRLQGDRATIHSCVIINDFVAQGYGCLSLSSAESAGELYHLHGDRKNNQTGPKFCLGAGTGFGSCYMVPIPTRSNHSTSSSIEYTCLPSEYGQSDWAPPMGSSENNKNQKELVETLVEIWNFLRERPNRNQSSPHISIEDVVSGTGLATSYECLARLYPDLVDENVQKQFQSEQDLRGKVVGENAFRCPICERAVEAVMCAYGSVVGSCAMSFLPTGGLYVTGGLLLNLLRQEQSNAELHASNEELLQFLSEESHLLWLFLESYKSKGPASFLLNEIPLSIVLAKDAGLRGAAVRAEMIRFE